MNNTNQLPEATMEKIGFRLGDSPTTQTGYVNKNNQKYHGTLGVEGSRSKAAVGASHFGIAIKISSDGGITNV